MIVQLFGSNDFFNDVAKSKVKTVLLKNPAMHIVEKHKLLGLQVMYAKAVHVTNTAKWKSKITVSMTGYIPIINDNMPLFSFPEYSNERECLEPHTLDYTHMLTNLRSLICRKGIENVKTSAFVKVCEEHPEIVSCSIVIECIDKQNADHALQMISKKVEEQLTKNGNTSEALFVCLVHNWHKACDGRGMAADDRVNNLWAFYTYLVKDIDFNHFPASGA